MKNSEIQVKPIHLQKGCIKWSLNMRQSKFCLSGEMERSGNILRLPNTEHAGHAAAFHRSS